MSKLTAFSLAYLSVVSVATLSLADEGQDPFGNAGLRVAENQVAGDPSDPTELAIGSGDPALPSDPDDPFGSAARRRSAGPVGMGGGIMGAGRHPVMPGAFTVVSDGKRSIKMNTATGDSWLLVIDDTSSRWEPIRITVQGEKTSDKSIQLQEKLMNAERSHLERKVEFLETELAKCKATQVKLEAALHSFEHLQVLDDEEERVEVERDIYGGNNATTGAEDDPFGGF